MQLIVGGLFLLAAVVRRFCGLDERLEGIGIVAGLLPN